MPLVICSKVSLKADVCYKRREERLNGKLNGSFKLMTEPRQPAYFNLSCPFEWSKYSCIHQDQVDTANEASRLVFEPDGCNLHEHVGSTLARITAQRRVYFVGDSLVRQLMIALLCAAHSSTQGEVFTKTVIAWPKCPREWPCHGVNNCITCGPHSGTGFMAVTLAGGAVFTFLDHKNAEAILISEAVTSDDVIIISSSIHGDRAGNTLKMMKLARDHLSSANLIWFVAWSPHFPTSTNEYNVTALQRLVDNGTRLTCRTTAPSQIQDTEIESVQDIADILDGVLWLPAMNDMGDYKVGGHVGAYTDCQHYCLPGPPDEMARALYTMLTQILP